MSRFPLRSLKPAGGKFYSWIFQNKVVNLPRNHFWSFTIDFKQVVYDDMNLKPAMTIEWVALPLRRWKDLVGLKFRGRYGDNGIESTFYSYEHDYADRFSLEVLARRGTSFLIRMEMAVEFQGRKRPKLRVRAQTWLTYEGLSVPEQLDRLKPTLKQARVIRRRVHGHVRVRSGQAR